MPPLTLAFTWTPIVTGPVSLLFLAHAITTSETIAFDSIIITVCVDDTRLVFDAWPVQFSGHLLTGAFKVRLTVGPGIANAVDRAVVEPSIVC